MTDTPEQKSLHVQETCKENAGSFAIDEKARINTNDLRDFADKMPAKDREYLYSVAAEMDETRTERNLARVEVKSWRESSRGD